MSQVVTNEYAGPGERFAPDVFDSQVGNEVPFKINGETIGTCSLLGVSVAEDGSFVTMTFEIPDVFSTDVAGLCVHRAGDER
jgi:hypothetical protein